MQGSEGKVCVTARYTASTRMRMLTSESLVPFTSPNSWETPTESAHPSSKQNLLIKSNAQSPNQLKLRPLNGMALACLVACTNDSQQHLRMRLASHVVG